MTGGFDADDWNVAGRPAHPDYFVISDLLLQGDAAADDGADKEFIDHVNSWQEQRNVTSVYALAALADHPLAATIAERMAAWAPMSMCPCSWKRQQTLSRRMLRRPLGRQASEQGCE